jgi:hypothetical protein
MAEAEINELQPFINSIEEALPHRGAVCQLPFQKDFFSEPSTNWPHNCFTKLRPYLLSRDIRWSYAFPMFARKDALITWERDLMAKQIPDQIAEIISSGFCGIFVDRREFDASAHLEFLKTQQGYSFFESKSRRYLFVRFDNSQYSRIRESGIGSGSHPDWRRPSFPTQH